MTRASPNATKPYRTLLSATERHHLSSTLPPPKPRPHHPSYPFETKCRDFEIISHLSHLEPTAALLEVIETNQVSRG